MQNESKGVYVQMPKPDNDEVVKILADLVEVLDYSDPKSTKEYDAAIEYLEKNKVLSEATV